MTPRRYRMRARQATADETRARLVAAARRLLTAKRGIAAFTIDAVATAAGVSRMTVYHHFGSKTGLIEAVFDSLAIVATGVPRLRAALESADPLDTLDAFVVTFAEVWQADRGVIRRLQGLAATDPEFGRVWHRREERRREGLRTIVSRLAVARGTGRSRSDVDLRTSVLFALIAFETYDVIAGPRQPLEAIAPVIRALARTSLGAEGSEPVGA